MDEYATSSLPEFEGKKFQKVAKEGFNLDGDTEAAKKQGVKKKSLTKWLSEDALKDYILHAEISERLVDSPCVLITLKSFYKSFIRDLFPDILIDLVNLFVKIKYHARVWYLNEQEIRTRKEELKRKRRSKYFKLYFWLMIS